MSALETLNEALEAWRRTRHPRWAQVADWASARALKEGEERPVIGASSKKADVAAWRELEAHHRALDLPRLVAALGGSKSPIAAERVELLALWDDPRLVTLLLGVLEAPPWRAKTALPFFRAVASALEKSRDVRARDGMKDLATRFKGILETSVGDDVGALLRRTSAAMEDLPPPRLTSRDEERVAELEAGFERERGALARTASAKRSAKHTDAELLAAVYAAPDDDAPRLVFADALLERGDERGELIQLQVKRARGKATDATLARERELQGDPTRVALWALPLSNGADCTLARGFPHHLDLRARAVKQIIGLDAWATVASIRGLDSLSAKQSRELLLHPAAGRLKSVGSLKAPLPFTSDAPWTEVSLGFVPDAAFLGRLPALRHLRLLQMTGQLDAWKPGVFRANAALRELSVAWAPVPPLDELTQLEVVDLWDAYPGAPALEHLGRFPALRTLRLQELPSVELLAGLQVTHLGLRNLRHPPKAVLDAVPTLESLEWKFGVEPGSMFAELLQAAPGTKLRTITHTNVRIEAANTAQAVLQLRPPVRLEQVDRLVAALPRGAVSSAVLMPWTPRSPKSLGPAIPAEAQQALREAFAKAGIAFEVDWR